MAKSRNPNLVKANQQFEYTAEQIKELKKCIQDPIYFVRKYVRIQHPVKGSIPFELYPYQEELLDNFHRHRFNIIMSARQTGKSVLSAAFLLWFAIFNDDKTVLIVSNKNDNAMEMISRIQFMYEYLPHWMKPGIVEDGWNKHACGFDNGSRILSMATTETSGRGLSISLLFCDEFAFVRPGIQETFWTSIQPTLSTGGACIIASTPNGDSNLFATLWRQAEAGVNSFKSRWVKWDEPPGRDESFKQEQIAQIGHDKWLQEFECMFLSSEAMLFNSVILAGLSAGTSSPQPNERGIKIWKPLEKGKIYLLGVDPATGSGTDFSVIELYEFPSLEQVMEFRSNTTSTPHLYLTIKYILKQAQKAGSQVYFSVENNGVGEGIIALYEADEDLPEVGEMISEEGKSRIGMTTTGKVKLKACLNFKSLVERNRMKIRSTELLKEMKNYIRKSGSYEANLGSTDDGISASLIVVRILEEIATYEQDAYDTLYSIDEGDFFNEFNEEQYDDKDEGMPIIMGGETGGSVSGGFSDPFDPNSFDPWIGRG